MFATGLLAAAALILQSPLVGSLPRIPLPRPSATAARASVNDNREPAGTRAGRVLTLVLDVVNGAWKPEGENDPEVPVLVFAERGHAAQVPGPLIRVAQGTEVRLTITNKSDTALTIGGLRPGVTAATDTFSLAAGASRELHYRLDAPGTYFYWGALAGGMFTDRLWLDSQLNGALVVDPPGGAPPDRIFVISEWFYPYQENRPFEVVDVINGKGWPYTERITLNQGDSTRFRVLNTIDLHHPMHLHGFYYRVVARGRWNQDRPIAPALQPILNTDLLPPGGTLTLAFVPTTPGNWLFHCHFSFHINEEVTLSGGPRDSAEAAHPMPPSHDSEQHMRGLVIGIHVNPAPGYVPYAAANPRDIKLLIQKKPDQLIGNMAAYGFVMQEGDSVPAKDSVNLPGPVLELVRGKPVRISVLNNLDEPTSIHWHGLEIPSFPDGVPNWSGMGDHVFSQIAPGETFVAEFTPPRAGTFPYHSHLNERHQIQSGMYGAIIVTDKPRDLAHDHLIVAGGGGPAVSYKVESPFALVNGSRNPDPIRLSVGEVHRLRIVSIHPDWRIAFTLLNDSTVAHWRAVAKDGRELPRIQATLRAAHVEMGPGETADFEFRPTVPGEWRLEIKSVESGWYIPLTVIVTPAAKASSTG